LVFHRQVDADGRRWTIPIVQGQGDLHLKPSEQWMTDLVRRLAAARRGTFLDVGANLGQTLLHVRAAVPDLPSLACEPIPAAVDYLHRLIRANRLDDCRVYPVALGREPGAARIHITAVHQHSSLLTDEWRRPVDAADTIVIPGDDLLRWAGVNDVTIVKIDVEGYEVEVVAGLRKTLATRRPFVIYEVLPYDTRDAAAAARSDELEREFNVHRYVCRRVHPDSRIEPVKSHAQSYPIERHHEIDFSDANFLRLPEEMAAEFDRHATGSKEATELVPAPSQEPRSGPP
jgi:FkbM family methyltransferase